MKALSGRAVAITESATLAVSAKARELAAAGVDMVDFGVGEPDFDTPAPIKRAAIEAIDRGFTKYTASSGILDLRRAIAAKLLRDQGLQYDPSQIVVSNGGKHALFNAICAICEEGDEVILPSPYWVSYLEMIKLVGAKAVIVEGSERNRFLITAEQLQKAITPRTKLLILNSPSNPTGMLYSERELRALAEVAVQHDLYVLSDEIYEKLVFGVARHFSIASFGDEIFKRTVVVNGVSKTYAMTGWRIGYAAGPKAIMAAIGNVQSHTTSNSNSIAQKAALFAISGDERPVQEMREEFDRRRRVVVQRLNAIPNVRCVEPQGAFYAFPNVSGLYGKRFGGKVVKNSVEFALVCLEQAHTALVPGEAFGADAYVRISYATSMDTIQKGMDRLEKLARSAE